MTHADRLEYPERLAGVRRGLSERGAVAAIFGLSSNLRYLTGFTDEPGERALLLVVPHDGEAAMIVPELYADQVRSHAPETPIRVWRDGEDPMQLVRSNAEELRDRPGCVLLDDTLWVTFTLPIQDAFEGRSFGLASDVVGPLRMCKGSEEVASMRRAGEIADGALEDALAGPICGLTESQLAGRLEAAMLDRGADAVAFETLVASGANSALPHYRAGRKRIESGDVVILDYGCRVAGYCSDITRTVVCGEADPKVERVYAAVQLAHTAARDRVGVGVRAGDIDAAARSVLTDGGFGPNFLHRTGHGIGLDVHEPPYIVEKSQEELKAGMAFSIEPGAYFTGEFGVRLEDVVVVGEAGAVPMTEASRDLRRVD